MGTYLLSCLGFVIFALGEFAVIILLHKREGSVSKGEAKYVIPQTLKIEPTDTDCPVGTPTVRPVENQRFGKLMTNVRKIALIIPTTHVLDLMAVWVYLISFLIFNCIYFNSY